MMPSQTRDSRRWSGRTGEFRPPRWSSPARHLPDGSRYPTAGHLVGRWQERHLRHGEGDALGEPVRLTPFDRYLLQRMYEYHPTTGRLLYDRILVGVGKGNSKTEAGGRVGVAELVGPIAPISPRVIMAASGFDQSNELFTASRLSLVGTPDHPTEYARHFRDGDNLLDTRITLPDGHGELERIAAAGGATDGGKPTCFLADELHEWLTERQERVWIVQSKGLRKRRVLRRTPPELGLPDGVRLRGGFSLGITTQGVGPDNLLGRLYDHGVNVARGFDDDGRPIVDETFLFLWWEAWEGWDLDDPAQELQAILEANPNAGTDDDAWLPVDNIRASLHDPLVPRHEGVRYNLNRRPTGSESLITTAAWAPLAQQPLELDAREPAVAAVHVSHDHRTAAIALAQRIDDHYLVTVAAFPEATLPDGDVIPVADLEDHLRELHRIYPGLVVGKVRLRPNAPEKRVPLRGPIVVYHGAFFEGSAQRLRADRMALEDVPQTREKLAAAVEALRGLVHDGRLSHDGSAPLAAAIANLDGEPSPRGWYPIARDPRVPIDPALAAAVAVDRAMTAPRWSTSDGPPLRAAGF